MPNKRNLISFCVGGIAIFLLAAGAVSFLLWGTGNGGTTSTAVNDKSPMSNLRLSTDVRPIWYNVSIIAYVPGFISFEDPARNQTFEANVTIKIKPNNPTSRIELNARELTFTNLTVTSDVGDTIQVSNVEIQTNLTKVVLILNRQLEAGREYYIWVSYSGLIGDRIFGLYTSSYDTNDGTTKYLATTQMEPTGARLMVPCFDEPSFKAVWRVRIIHPKGTNAISNALEEQQNQPITENGNWLSTQFSETPPMSSYLLAVVVSDFAYKEATMKSTDGKDIRVRVWLRPEIIENSAWALESSMTILAMFERRFEIPFPIPKMDLVGVRDFPAGAMENFGLIIFKERYLPYNSTQDSTQHKALVADIIAHEFAHQWFGDIVTLNWWSNLFLNEGFASFMENTAKNGMYNLSAMENTIDFMEEHEAWGFWSDRLSTAHPLHYDFHGPEELGSIFDGIAYGKGSSILHMIETAIGSEVFYNGIRIYLKRHKFENADYTDLLKALDEAVQASNTNKGMSVKDFAQGWITQPNHPIVIANRIDETRVSLTQTPFILDFEISGDKIRRSWKIPIWYQVNGEDKDLLWLGDQALILENIGKDDLLIINPQSTGFYYVQYDDNLLERINKELTTNITYIPLVARGRVLGDTFWLAHAGYGTYDAAFNLTSYITREKESLPWKFLMDHLNFISSYLDSEPESKIAKEFISLMNDVRIKATSTSLLSAHTRLMAESKVPRIPFDNTRKMDSPYQQRHAMHLEGVFDDSERSRPIELASETGPEMELKMFREQFLEPCSSSSEAISSQCSTVPINIRDNVYCLGVKYEIVDFDFMVGMYEREVQKNEKIRLLYSLCCTQNVIGIKRLLRAAVNENAKPVISLVYADDVIISIVWESPIGRYIASDFFLDNWQSIYYRFVNEVGFGTLNSIIRNCLKDSSSRSIQALESFMNDQRNDLHAVQEFNRQLTSLKTRRHWIEKNLKPLTNFFTTQIAKAKEKTSA